MEANHQSNWKRKEDYYFPPQAIQSLLNSRVPIPPIKVALSTLHRPKKHPKISQLPNTSQSHN
jgi:hypothetical protein